MKLYKAFLYTLLVTLFQAIIGILIFFSIKQLNLDKNDAYEHSLGLFRTFAQIVGYFLFFYFFWKQSKSWIQKTDLKINNFKIITLLLVIAIGLELFKSLFFDYSNLLKLINKAELVHYGYNFNRFNTRFIYRTIAVLIISPIFEELFFRKFLINRLIKEHSKILALVISSICFALIHIETPTNLIPAFIFGIVSGLIYLKTNKIGYSMLLHFIGNSLWFFNVIIGNKFYNYLYSLEFSPAYWMLFIVGIALTYFGTKEITTAKSL